MKVINQYSSVKHFFVLSVSRQLLQVGEPAQRTGFSASLWYPAVSRFASTLKKLTLAKGFNLNPSVFSNQADMI